MVFLSHAVRETCIEIIEREESIAAGYDVTPMITPMPNVKFFFVKDPAGVKVQFV